MNVYRDSAIGIIGEWIRTMKHCQEHPETVVNDMIIARHQAQASILLGLIESCEGIRPDSRMDDLENMVIRLDVIKELFDVE